MIVALAVGLASGLGAVARYLTDRAVSRRHPSPFPWGTVTVNVTGSLLAGLVGGAAAHHGLAPGPAAVGSAGFCGGFSTWSTYAHASVALARTGAPLAALVNLVGSLAAGLVAAAAGFGLALL